MDSGTWQATGHGVHKESDTTEHICIGPKKHGCETCHWETDGGLRIFPLNLFTEVIMQIQAM